jgi:hypothetical protein
VALILPRQGKSPYNKHTARRPWIIANLSTPRTCAATFALASVGASGALESAHAALDHVALLVALLTQVQRSTGVFDLVAVPGIDGSDASLAQSVVTARGCMRDQPPAHRIGVTHSPRAG